MRWKLDRYDGSLKNKTAGTSPAVFIFKESNKMASWLFTATNENTYQSGRINAILQCNTVYSNLLFSNLSEYTNHKFYFPQRSKKKKQSKINNHLYTYTKNNRFLDKQNPNTLLDFDDYVSFDTYFGFFLVPGQSICQKQFLVNGL